MVDMVKLRETLEDDEGRIDAVYLDHLGLPTFGIGHLITKNDEEHKLDVGTTVTPERVFEVFEEDLKVIVREAEGIFPGYFELPEEVQQILANMMFNMGATRLMKFKKLRAAIAIEDWEEAAVQMKDSKWYDQVTNRADRLIARMEAVG